MVFNGGQTPVDFIIDIAGWYGATEQEGDLFNPVGPTRVLDSRESDPLAGKSSRTVDVTGVAGVPASGVTAIVANVTVTTISGYGYLTVHPSGIARPIASNINYAPGDTAVPNLVSVAVGADGNIVVFNGGQTPVDFIIDIAGWYGTALDELDQGDTLTEGLETDLSNVAAVIASATATASTGPSEGANPLAKYADLEKSESPVTMPAAGSGDGRLVESLPNTSLPKGDFGYLQNRPDPAVGRIYSYNADWSKLTGLCSGVVVARNLVLTAAHCVKHANYQFVPQQFGKETPLGSDYYATRYWISPYYENGSNKAADYAFLIFDNTDKFGD